VLGAINGADEGNLIVVIAVLLTYVFGDGIWHHQCQILSNTYEVIDIVLFWLAVGSAYTCIFSLKNVVKTKGAVYILNYLYESVLSIWIMLFPVFCYFLFPEQEFKDNLLLIYAIVSLMFSRVCIQIQCDIVGSQKYRSRRLYTLISTYVFFFVALFFKKICGIPRQKLPPCVTFDVRGSFTYVRSLRV